MYKNQISSRRMTLKYYAYKILYKITFNSKDNKRKYKADGKDLMQKYEILKDIKDLTK